MLYFFAAIKSFLKFPPTFCLQITNSTKGITTERISYIVSQLLENEEKNFLAIQQTNIISNIKNTYKIWAIKRTRNPCWKNEKYLWKKSNKSALMCGFWFIFITHTKKSKLIFHFYIFIFCAVWSPFFLFWYVLSHSLYILRSKVSPYSLSLKLYFSFTQKMFKFAKFLCQKMRFFFFYFDK